MFKRIGSDRFITVLQVTKGKTLHVLQKNFYNMKHFVRVKERNQRITIPRKGLSSRNARISLKCVLREMRASHNFRRSSLIGFSHQIPRTDLSGNQLFCVKCTHFEYNVHILSSNGNISRISAGINFQL